MDQQQSKVSSSTDGNKKCENRRSSGGNTEEEEEEESCVPLFDGEGRSLHDGVDRCDCKTPNCDGCFFPCRAKISETRSEECGSLKCGHVCRRNRTWEYGEAIRRDCLPHHSTQQ